MATIRAKPAEDVTAQAAALALWALAQPFQKPEDRHELIDVFNQTGSDLWAVIVPYALAGLGFGIERNTSTSQM